MRLLATTTSKAKMEQIINSYFFSNSYYLDANMNICHPTKQLKHFRVIQKGNRLRFEEI